VRDAAKRAPAKAGAAGTGEAANVNVNVNPVGDWTTQAEDPGALIRALGGEIVRQRAAEGDREAQFSLGLGLLKAAGTFQGSPKAEVGLALRTTGVFPVANKIERH